MGFLSWMTVDTNESISNKFSDRGALHVKMIDDKNNVYVETDYKGFGVFGGVDFFDLLLQMNETKGYRYEGIELYEQNTTIKKPKIVSLSCEKKWEELEDNVKDYDFRGFLYPSDKEEELFNIKELIEIINEYIGCENFNMIINHTYLEDKNFEKFKKKFYLKLKEIIGIYNFNYIISNENKFDNFLKNLIKVYNIWFLLSAIKKKDRKDKIYINVFSEFKRYFEELFEEGK